MPIPSTIPTSMTPALIQITGRRRKRHSNAAASCVSSRKAVSRRQSSGRRDLGRRAALPRSQAAGPEPGSRDDDAGRPRWAGPHRDRPSGGLVHPAPGMDGEVLAGLVDHPLELPLPAGVNCTVQFWCPPIGRVEVWDALRDGSRRAPVIDDELWSSVHEMRQRHSHRHPGPATYRQYLWSRLIRCRACGRRLTGHVERYRHVEACAAFRAARPGGTDPRHLGDSYLAAVYDEVAPRALAHVVAKAGLIAEVEASIGDRVGRLPDQFGLARIRRERQQATRRLEDDRDVVAWQTTMGRLDREEAEAQAAESPRLTSREIAESLADLQGLFADAEPATRHRIVQALFEQVEVLGPNEVRPYPSVEAEARGWAAAMSGELRVEVVRLVGARGVEPPGPTTRIVVPGSIAEALRAVA